MYTKSEREIEKKVCKYVEQLGGIAYKFTSAGRRAVPDRLILLPDVEPFFIEFKAPGKKASVLQKYEHQVIRDAGVIVEVVDNIKEGIELIDNILLANEPV